MTTNHIEKLDPALIRPGRCDVKVELKKASRDMAKRLFVNFFPQEKTEVAVEFAEQLPENELSMAQLQGYLLEYKTNAALALRNVPRLLRTVSGVDVHESRASRAEKRLGAWQTTDHRLQCSVCKVGCGYSKARMAWRFRFSSPYRPFLHTLYSVAALFPAQRWQNWILPGEYTASKCAPTNRVSLPAPRC